MKLRNLRVGAVVAVAVLALFSSAKLLAQQVAWDHTNVVYGTDDPSRQFLNIYLADTAEPAPVLFWAHQNGSTAFNVSQEQADTIVGEGYTLISWESIPSLSTPADLLTAWSDAQLAFDWVRANAATYNLDPDHFIIGGRSRGSGASWPLAHGGHPAIKGIYMYNALPDGFWQAPELWTPVVEVNADSPPVYFAYGPVYGSTDSHRPDNSDPVVARYDELGLGDDITITTGMWQAGISNVMFYFPDFVESLAPPPENISRVVPWSDPTYTYTVESDVVYGQGEVGGGGSFLDLRLDLYIPDVAPPAGAYSQFPLMLIIHGGGFSGGSKSAANFVSYAQEYASRGWLAASIDYRLMSDDPIPSSRVQALYDYVGGAAAPLQARTAVAAVDDTLTALDFLQSRQDVHAPWTALLGNSAGAITSLITAYSLDDHGIARPPVAAVLDHWGGIYGSSIGTPFDDPLGTDPVLLVVHGTADPTVPFSEAEALEAWAVAAGLPLDYHPVNGAGHGVNLFNATVPETGVTLFQRGVDFIDETVFDGKTQGPQPPVPPGC